MFLKQVESPLIKMMCFCLLNCLKTRIQTPCIHDNQELRVVRVSSPCVAFLVSIHDFQSIFYILPKPFFSAIRFSSLIILFIVGLFLGRLFKHLSISAAMSLSVTIACCRSLSWGLGLSLVTISQRRTP